MKRITLSTQTHSRRSQILCIAAALVIGSSLTAHAEGELEFRQMHQSDSYAKVSCLSRHEVSRSELSKHTSTYQAELTPREIKSVLRQNERLDFEQVETQFNLYTYGENALSSIESSSIALEIKTEEGETLSTTVFHWSSREPRMLMRLAARNPALHFIDMGQPRCKAKGIDNRASSCSLDPELNDDQGVLEPLYVSLYRHYHKNPGVNVIFEVTYNTNVYLDCAGRRSFALARDMNEGPQISLRKD